MITVILIIMTIIFIISNYRWITKFAYPIHYRDEIQVYTKEYNIDPYLVVAIMKNESGFNPKALSSKNAKGLMQIAAITGDWASKELNIVDYNEEMLYDPDLNIKIACWYLNVLHKEFDNNLELIIAAYNGGSGNVTKWLNDPRYSDDGITLKKIPFKETENYLKKVLRDYEIYKTLYNKEVKIWDKLLLIKKFI